MDLCEVQLAVLRIQLLSACTSSSVKKGSIARNKHGICVIIVTRIMEEA